MAQDTIAFLETVVGHFNGWHPQVIGPTNEAPEFLAQLYAEVSPDGLDHYPVVVSKRARSTSKSRR